MKERRKQFTIKTSRMRDEVYAFFEGLSSKGEFTQFVIQAGEEELIKQSNKGNKQELQTLGKRILNELLEIKSIVQSKTIANNYVGVNKESDVIVKLSSDSKVSSLELDDIEYDF